MLTAFLACVEREKHFSYVLSSRAAQVSIMVIQILGDTEECAIPESGGKGMPCLPFVTYHILCGRWQDTDEKLE